MNPHVATRGRAFLSRSYQSLRQKLGSPFDYFRRDRSPIENAYLSPETVRIIEKQNGNFYTEH